MSSASKSASYSEEQYLEALTTVATQHSLVPAAIRDLPVDRIARYLVSLRMWEDSNGDLTGHWPEGTEKDLGFELRRLLRAGIVEVANADHDIYDGLYHLTQLGRTILSNIEKAAGVDARPPYPGAI
jgi:hypothetical protein